MNGDSGLLHRKVQIHIRITVCLKVAGNHSECAYQIHPCEKALSGWVGAVSQSHLADCDDRLPHLIRRLNELRLGSWKTEFVNENLRAEILSMKLKSVHHTLFKTSVLTSIKCKSMFAVQHSVSHAQTLAPQSTSCSFICSSYFNLASLVLHFCARASSWQQFSSTSMQSEEMRCR